MPVGGEGSVWLACLPVEVDCGAEREDAGGDPCPEPVRGSYEVVLEPQLVFQAVDDRTRSVAG
jgi:hypothetical protein